MKYIIILGDGMSDYPIKSLGNKTPLMAANIPHIDELCRKGRSGLLKTISEGFQPGSEAANLSVMGYDIAKVLNGRGVLEAASMGVMLEENDLALRCNLINITDGKIKNHSAGHITTEEAKEIIVSLNEKFGTDKIKFYPGVSYRHLLVIKGGNDQIKCTPPHDVPGADFDKVMIKAISSEGEKTAELLNQMILDSQQFLLEHQINKKRIELGKDAANSIWPWSPGFKPKMKTLQELYGKTGAVISAVDLIQGIGVYAGMKVIKVEGVTGLYNTNYEGKAKAAVDAIKEVDFVYVHVEASDEAGHDGNIDLKIKTIEYLDQRIVKYIMEETAKMNEPVAIAVLPDHPTPVEMRIHVSDPVPFLIYNPTQSPDSVNEYNELSVLKGSYGLLKGDEFIKAFFCV